MATDYSTLLALDSMASEQSVRVAVYDRALNTKRVVARAPPVESIAERFFAFVQGQRWRLEALDAASNHANRRDTIERLIENAETIAAWADPEPTPIPVLDTRPKKKRAAKKKH